MKRSGMESDKAERPTLRNSPERIRATAAPHKTAGTGTSHRAAAGCNKALPADHNTLNSRNDTLPADHNKTLPTVATRPQQLPTAKTKRCPPATTKHANNCNAPQPKRSLPAGRHTLRRTFSPQSRSAGIGRRPASAYLHPLPPILPRSSSRPHNKNRRIPEPRSNGRILCETPARKRKRRG